MSMKDKTNKSKECCEKCYEVILVTQISSANEKVITFEQIQCSNKFCPCHTKAPQKKDTSWRERMASAFNGAMHGCGVGYGENQEWLFRAVEQEIQKAKEQTISSVIEEIEKIIKYEENRKQGANEKLKTRSLHYKVK